ncbi:MULTISPECIES: hypothetical protein [unclassified Methylobacterium]|uniref:hypothetical protein n=1 Tax=unclassified Methylobacterium TaxID=2615210 RepID=UPI0012377730|nr:MULTISPECIES: hypothetical protein [Methylobacterium]WFT78505.1 hypothetical protein QA634_25000 [Methylobacterium nodulans]
MKRHSRLAADCAASLCAWLAIPRDVWQELYRRRHPAKVAAEPPRGRHGRRRRRSQWLINARYGVDYFVISARRRRSSAADRSNFLIMLTVTAFLIFFIFISGYDYLFVWSDFP